MAERVAESGDDLAIADEFGRWTWAEYDQRVNRLANAMRGLGVAAGSTVALVGNNRHEWCESVAAGGGLGLVTVPVNWHFSAEEIAYVIENSGADVVIADVEFADKVAAAAEQAGAGVRIAFGGSIDGFVDYDEVLAGASADEPADQSMGSTMFYTSGTTGRPKGVRSSAFPLGGDVLEGAQRLQLLLSLFEVPVDGLVLCNAPLYHSGPTVFGLLPFFAGASLLLRRKWDAEETLRLIDEYSVSNYYAVPTHFNRLLRLPEATREAFSGASLRHVVHTAAPIAPETKRQMIEWWGPVLYELYGATEGSGASTWVNSEEWMARPGTVGKAVPICEVLIVDDDGRRLGPNEHGQIYFRSLIGADFEYLGEQEKTESVHLEPGVYSFGDIGYLDEDGYLFLSDRKIDMIISGGVNIYPAEIEAVLLEHPLVLDVGVFGIPNDEFGEEVKAAVELPPDTDPVAAEAELRRFCRERLAGYMVPRSFDFGPLPRTATGKLPKRELRAPYWDAVGRSI
jgi:long-chain acyl-CoA synthetase